MKLIVQILNNTDLNVVLKTMIIKSGQYNFIIVSPCKMAFTGPSFVQN
mgnify:CR=1 FL=1